jgi:hypothetical protein
MLRRQSSRILSFFEGRTVRSEELVKKQPDWVIEETNFCLGRMGPVQFREEDDLPRRSLQLMNTQVNKMHTRLRDGTCIPYMSLFLPDLLDKPIPAHTFLERPLLKYTWDETYEEAYEPFNVAGKIAASK